MFLTEASANCHLPDDNTIFIARWNVLGAIFDRMAFKKI